MIELTYQVDCKAKVKLSYQVDYRAETALYTERFIGPLAMIRHLNKVEADCDWYGAELSEVEAVMI